MQDLYKPSKVSESKSRRFMFVFHSTVYLSYFASYRTNANLPLLKNALHSFGK